MAVIAENGNNRDTAGSKSMDHGKLTKHFLLKRKPLLLNFKHGRHATSRIARAVTQQ